MKVKRLAMSMLNLGLRKKLPAKDLSFRRRHGTGQKLTAKDQVFCEKSQRYIMFILLKLRKDPLNHKYRQLLQVLWVRHIAIAYVEDIP